MRSAVTTAARCSSKNWLRLWSLTACAPVARGVAPAVRAVVVGVGATVADLRSPEGERVEQEEARRGAICGEAEAGNAYRNARRKAQLRTLHGAPAGKPGSPQFYWAGALGRGGAGSAE